MGILTLVLVIFSILPERSSDSSIFKCGPCQCVKENETFYADCSNKNLTSVPQTLPLLVKKINISSNTVSNLKNSLNKYTHLQYLDISNNQLFVLNKQDFFNLKHLEILDLHSNHLNLCYDVYPKGLFKDQKKLRHLILHRNSHIYTGVYYPDETFSDLPALEQLRIDGIHNFTFGSGFIMMKSLSNLSVAGYCDIGKIGNGTFKYISGLRYLSLTGCSITHIEPAAFSDLQVIHTLDISENRDLGLVGACIGLHGIRNSSIKVLKMNRLHRYHGTGILVRKHDVEFIQDTEIEELQLNENRIELFDKDVPLLVPNTLKVLSARDNMFLFGLYILTASTLKVEVAHFSGQHKSYIRPLSIDEPYGNPSCPLGDESLSYPVSHKVNETSKLMNTFNHLDLRKLMDGPWPGNFSLSVPKNATFFNVSNSKLTYTIHELHFDSNNLKILDLSFNFFSRWEGPVTGLEQLEYLDLSHNYCDYMSDEISLHLPAMRVLNISSNYLGYSITNRSFEGFHNLHYLILSNNKLSILPSAIFQNLRYLNHLDLSNNFLESWDPDIVIMSNLTELDLSFNSFQTIPETLQYQVENMPTSPLRINISNNPLKCTCTTLPALKWIISKGKEIINYRELVCTQIDGSVTEMLHIEDIVLKLDALCTSYIGVMIGTLVVVVMVIVLVITGITYRYRWKLRYLYYLMMNRHHGYLPVLIEERDFEFDAFVSYADEDRTFVVNDMRKTLEEAEEHDERLRLCIHHRDFLPGEAIASNILKAINTSRKTVVILTRNFLKSYWCRYEVEMAKMESIYRGRNTLLIVVMEDIPVKDLPADIVDVMRKDSYAEFTNDSEGQKVFWLNLKRGIRQG